MTDSKERAPRRRSIARNSLWAGVSTLSLSLLTGAMAPAQAADWTGALNNSWTSAGNWSPPAVPNSGTTVNINTGLINRPVITTAGQQAFSVTLGSSAVQTGALTIDGGALTANNAGFNPGIAVGDLGTGELLISNGGKLTTNNGYVALNLGSTGTATVTGTGSQWTITNWFDVGSSGDGTLNITNGGVVTFSVAGRTATFGNDNTANGKLFVSGTGSQFTAASTAFGNAAGSEGHAEISANGQFNSGATTVGNNGAGSMLFQTGGDGSVSTMTIGNQATGTVTVDGAGSTLAATGAMQVGYSKAGSLTVRNGGVVTSASGSIGTFNGASGTVTVTGANSRWTITNGLQISQTGSTATGTLDILAGGSVSASSFSSFNGGQVTVDGTNSRLTLTNSMNFGSATSPGGSLTISDEGVVSAGSFTGNNSMVVDLDGEGSQLNLLGGTSTSTTFTMGVSGTGNKLDITGGADMATQRANLSTSATSGIVVNVDGAGTTWNATGILLDGAGSASFTVSGGAVVNVNTGADPDLTIDGPDASLKITTGASVNQGNFVSNTGQFTVGENATGSLLIDTGGDLTSRFSVLGESAGSEGTATVTGAGSTWTNRGVQIGFDGKGSLTIENGGVVTSSGSSTLAFSPGSEAEVLVSGMGSQWVFTLPPPLSGLAGITVGNGGTAVMRVEDGAYVRAEGIGVGSASYDFLGGTGLHPGNGTLVVTGAGTKVDLDLDTFQTFDAGGDGGTGVIQVLDGAVVTVVGQGHFGESVIYSGATPDQLFGSGTLIVDGAGSRVTYTQTLDVGEQATGVLTVSNGGFVSNGDAYIGSYASQGGAVQANGTVNVTGVGSTWETTGTLIVGDRGGIGALNISGGATVTNSGAATIAADVGVDGSGGGLPDNSSAVSAGTVVVTGAGSSWTGSDSLTVGRRGTAILTVSAGGEVSNTDTIIADDTGSSGQTTVSGAGSTWTSNGTLAVGKLGTATLTIADGGVVNSGAVSINNLSTLSIGNGGMAGVLNAPSIDNGGVLKFDHTDAVTFTVPVSGTGSLVKSGSGELVLPDTNTFTYTGTTAVDGGLLSVNGDISSSSLLTVASGGTLGGNGTVGATLVNGGGRLAPGNSIGTLAVSGTLTFAAGSTYAVEVDAISADRTNVSGTADLSGGTVAASYAGATYVKKTYTIVNAQGGLGGTSFAGLTGTAPTGFTQKLTYDSSNAYLVLDLVMREPEGPGEPGKPTEPGTPEQPGEPGTPGGPGTPEQPSEPEQPEGLNPFDGISINQRSVANAIVGYFDANGGVPAEFAALDPYGLSLVSGEPTAGAISAGIKNADLFLDLLSDQALAGRNATGGAGPAASAYADEGAGKPEQFGALGMEAEHAADPVARINGDRVAGFESRWQGWGGVYGGSLSVDGDAVQGSHNTDADTFGIAGGISRRWEDTVVGVALGGGYSSFDLSDALGSGHADIFNAGIFARQGFGPAYVSAAAAYGYNAVEITRTIAPDTLTGAFDAHSFSGRVEAGYGVATPVATLTPYAAFQAIAYRLPDYTETGTGSFALSYEADTTTVTRTELGARLDHLIGLESGATLTLSGRAALAINAGDDIGFTAGFVALPGANFEIVGATPDRYSALVDAGAEYRTANGFFAALAFQGEFSSNTTSVAGKARLGFEW